jgi:tRNA(Ser,Leu) C12 N-acetylase TAN1
MDTTAIIEELEDVASRLGVEVRSEPGNFHGGRCVVEGEEIIMLNENDLPETQLVVLAEALREAPLDTIYLKPTVRRALEEAWVEDASAEASHDD